MSFSEEVTRFVATMAELHERDDVPAGSLVAEADVWRAGRGKLHRSSACPALAETSSTMVRLDLGRIGLHRLCGKCWGTIPSSALCVQTAAKSLANTGQQMRALAAGVDAGRVDQLPVHAAGDLRRHATAGRLVAESDRPYPQPLRDWAAASGVRAGELAPQIEALLAADPDREIRYAATTLMTPDPADKKARTPVPGGVQLHSPALTGRGEMSTGQDGVLIESWVAWRNTVRGTGDLTAARRAATDVAQIGERTPRLIAQLPDAPAVPGSTVVESSTTVWRTAAAAELEAAVDVWADMFTELCEDRVPVVATWWVTRTRNTTAKQLLSRADVVESDRVAMAVLPAVCASLLGRAGVAAGANEPNTVRPIPVTGAVPHDVLAAAARLWADNRGKGTPLDAPTAALRAAADMHGLPGLVAD